MKYSYLSNAFVDYLKKNVSLGKFVIETELDADLSDSDEFESVFHTLASHISRGIKGEPTLNRKLKVGKKLINLLLNKMDKWFLKDLLTFTANDCDGFLNCNRAMGLYNPKKTDYMKIVEDGFLKAIKHYHEQKMVFLSNENLTANQCSR